MNMENKYKLYQCRTTQPFRVAYGKSKWFWYDADMRVQREWNLREILESEIVIEFDTTDQNKAWEGINFTAINLYNAGFIFEVFDHEGKSPHLHIHNLPITHLPKEELKTFKKVFIKTYVPEEYLDCVDFSLCGVHLVALEFCNHWKGTYSIKRLLHKFNPQEQTKE
jgi:hypothetical protein